MHSLYCTRSVSEHYLGIICVASRLTSSYSAAKEGKKMVVIGSSFIGMEVVGAVAKRKLASIDVVSMEEVPFQAVLGKEVGAGLKKVCTGN